MLPTDLRNLIISYGTNKKILTYLIDNYYLNYYGDFTKLSAAEKIAVDIHKSLVNSGAAIDTQVIVKYHDPNTKQTLYVIEYKLFTNTLISNNTIANVLKNIATTHAWLGPNGINQINTNLAQFNSNIRVVILKFKNGGNKIEITKVIN